MNIIVTGPESSGTRFVSRWLEAHPDVTARHWSMPSGDRWARHWPTDHDFDGEEPDAVVWVIRSFEQTIRSQLARGMRSCREDAEAAIIQAHLRILAWAIAHGARTIPVLYDAVVADPTCMSDVFRLLGLTPQPSPWPVIDGNAKHRDPTPEEEPTP